MKTVTYFLLALVCLAVMINCQTQNFENKMPQTSNKPVNQNSQTPHDPIAQPTYTQNLAQFKDKQHYNARSEKMLACWLYLQQQKKSTNFSEAQWLHLIKKCMRKISRKQSVLKITQLGNRNAAPPSPFSSILNLAHELSHMPAPLPSSSQFDTFLVSRSKQFTIQMQQILKKGNINEQIEQQLKKRQKYYLGFIPASLVNHTNILVAITGVMMCCCTGVRFYRAKEKIIEARRARKEGNAGAQGKGRGEDQDDAEQIMGRKSKGGISRKKSSKSKGKNK